MKFLSEPFSFFKKVFFIVFLGVLFLAFPLKAANKNLVFRPSIGFGTVFTHGSHLGEVRLGGTMHFVRLPLVFTFYGFKRLSREDFWGLDMDFKIKRQFRIVKDYLLGTELGPGYRWASQDQGAYFTDFAFSLAQIDVFSFQLGYKIVWNEWESSLRTNEALVYFGFQLPVGSFSF